MSFGDIIFAALALGALILISTRNPHVRWLKLTVLVLTGISLLVVAVMGLQLYWKLSGARAATATVSHGNLKH